jgi:hypothetical protein
MLDELAGGQDARLSQRERQGVRGGHLKQDGGGNMEWSETLSGVRQRTGRCGRWRDRGWCVSWGGAETERGVGGC